jgi:LCP family protein required for cell wall assembly
MSDRSTWKRRVIRGTAVLALTTSVVCIGLVVAVQLILSEPLSKAERRLPKSIRGESSVAAWKTRTVLVVGSDARTSEDEGASDAVLLVRIDPLRGRLALLSIPRGLMVEDERGNATHLADTMLDGGIEVTVSTVRRLGLDVDDVFVAEFGDLRSLVDDLGGIDVTNNRPIESTSTFDGRTWRFGTGELHLSGVRALAYARVRTNTFAKTESDSDRTLRQQKVFIAIAKSLLSHAKRHPREAAQLTLKGIDTNVSPMALALASQAMFRGSHEPLRCRLGGDLKGISPMRKPLTLLRGSADSKLPDYAVSAHGAVRETRPAPRQEEIVAADVPSGLYLVPSQTNRRVLAAFEDFQVLGDLESTPLAAACER